MSNSIAQVGLQNNFRMSEEMLFSGKLKAELVGKYGVGIIEELNSAWKINFVQPFIFSHFGNDLLITAKDLLPLIENFRRNLNELSQKSIEHERGLTLAERLFGISKIETLLRSVVEDVSLMIVPNNEGCSPASLWAGKSGGRPLNVAFGEFLWRITELLTRKHRDNEICIDWDLVIEVLEQQSQHDYRLHDQAKDYLGVQNIRALSSLVYRRKKVHKKNSPNY